MAGNRTADTAFWPDTPSSNPHSDYFSVNALELESYQVIADYHREREQDGKGKVALCARKVFEFNEAGKKGGIDISFDEEKSKWLFRDLDDQLRDAYLHHPRHDKLTSYSHCGIEFYRKLAEHKVAQFVRRLGGKKYHLY